MATEIRGTFPKGTWQAEAQALGKKFFEQDTDESALARVSQIIDLKRNLDENIGEIIKKRNTAYDLGSIAVSQPIDQMPTDEV